MQIITVEMTDTLYQQLWRASELTRQPIGALVVQSLTHSLPPLLEDIPEEYQADVYPLLAMSDAELQAEARKRFSADQWAEYETLLSKKKLASLSTNEGERLDTLRRAADVLTLRKGYAAVLLKRRGYQLPTLAELERAS